MASWEEFSRIVTEAKVSKKLDPVGQEDDDVDNDGDSDSSDSYLKKRRAAVGAAIASDRKKKVDEALDPVGQEDKDIDNDGDHDKSDKYLLNRRKVRSKIIAPRERLKTDNDMFNIPKSEQDAARERILAKTKAKRMKEEVEQIDEIAPLAIGAGVAAAAATPYLMKKFAKPAVDKAINKPATGSGGLIDKMKQRRDATNSAIQQLRQSYEFEGEKIDESELGDRARRVVGDQRQGYHGDGDVLNKTRKKLDSPVLKSYPGGFPSFKGASKATSKTTQVAHFEPEGEMVEEDKEYRREMRKAAARERSEEKRERKGEGKKSAKAPGRLGKSAGTSYADKEHLSIKGHDEVTKKSGHTVGNPFPEDYVVDGEYIQEKSLSRAQQRFMGMVYAAKKGGAPASPEVAKAASGMSKKAARDFAKTKHEGLPEKKEETKEELSLIDKMIMEFSPLSEGKLDDLLADIRGEDDGGKKKPKPKKPAEKKPTVKKSETERKEQSKEEVKTRNTATERAARTSAAGRVKAARIARETEKEKESARTARQRERISYTEKTREARAKQKELETKKKEEVSAAKEKQKQERSAAKETQQQERSAAKEAAKEKQSAAKAKQKELEKKEKEKVSELKRKEDSRKRRRSELRSDVKSAWSGSTKVAGDKKDTEAVAAGVSNAASLAAGVAKTGLALGKYAYKKATEKRGDKDSKPSKVEKKEPAKSEPTEKVSAKSDEKKTDTTPKKLTGSPEPKKLPATSEKKKLVPSTKRLPAAGETGQPKRETGMRLGQRARRNPALKSSLIKSRMEEYSNWREEFIFEVDDQSTKQPKEKKIDVMKGKNQIEINPNMSEGCGCDEKEDAQKKDMRGLSTKINLLKTKARLMGSKNPMVMVVSKEELEIEEGMTLKDFKANRRKLNRREASADAEKRGHVGKEWYNSGRKYSPDEAKSSRANMDDEERRTRHRSAVDPDDEDDNNYSADKTKNPKKLRKQKAMGESASWTKKEGKSEAGGLNEKGRKSYERENPGSDLKAPSKKVGNPRRASFCSRMSGMKAKLTSKKTANDPDSRINKSLRAWNC